MKHSMARYMFLALLACSVAVQPLSGREVKLWPDGAPGAKGSGPNDTPTLKVFPPPTWHAEAPVPAVLLIPGGGYKHISGYGTYRDFFQTRPVRFFSMKYRLPVNGYRHPAPLQDAQRAVRLIRANAKKWHIDAERVLVVGFSSGGHVATTLATQHDPGKADAEDPVQRMSCRPDYMALFCPVISMKNHPHRPSVVRLLGPDPDVKLIDRLSNELQVTAGTPPTFLAHAKDDGLVPPENSIQYHESLKKAGVATTLKLFRQGGHGVTAKPNPWQAHLGDWMSEIGILPEGVARPRPGAPGIYEPDASYTVQDLAGWQVMVHNALLPGGKLADTGARAKARLVDAMRRLKTWMPAAPLARLLKVKIWLEVDSTNGPWGRTSGYQYHPGRDWLIDMDFNPGKHKCVEFGNASSLARRSPDSTVSVLLHELAHAYHDQVLTFDDPHILAAYKRCVEGDAYPARDWVKSDHKEFFAGATTRYFGRRDEREAVGKRDPVLEKYLNKIWGSPKAVMDTPWEGGEVDAGLNDRLIREMKSYFGDKQWLVNHTLAVHGYAVQLHNKEGGDALVVKAGALYHDIGIPEARRIHGSAAGKYQEIEGPPIARKILDSLGVAPDAAARICSIIAHHHTARDKATVGTIEFKIVWDADGLVNHARRKLGDTDQEIERRIDQLFRTATGRKMARAMFIKH